MMGWGIFFFILIYFYTSCSEAKRYASGRKRFATVEKRMCSAGNGCFRREWALPTGIRPCTVFPRRNSVSVEKRPFLLK